METKHTPYDIRYHEQSGSLVYDQDGKTWVLGQVKSDYNGQNKADGERIAIVWNSHDDLVAALMEAKENIQRFYTATTTNAKGRDDNQELKNFALTRIEQALEGA